MLEMLKEFNIVSVCFRLVLATLVGAIIGFGRSRQKQTAGMRTYLITCVGAALAALIGFYEYAMLKGDWSALSALTEIKFDGSRFASSVISGIGFLAAGSIMLIAHQQISGLTTAVGLFITACIGIAAGAGYYEIVVIATVFIVIVMELMQSVEVAVKRRMRNMTLHVDFNDLDNINVITDAIKNEGATVYEYEFENGKKNDAVISAIIYLKLSRENPSHSAVLSSVAELPCVSSAQELIS